MFMYIKTHSPKSVVGNDRKHYLTGNISEDIFNLLQLPRLGSASDIWSEKRLCYVESVAKDLSDEYYQDLSRPNS